jgi:hypothetical protein
MSNRSITARIVELHEQYRRGSVSLDEFARGVEGHAQGLEGMDYHRHLNRIATITHALRYPLPRDGNIVKWNESDTLAMLGEFEIWLRDVQEWIRQNEPPCDPDE